MFKKKVLLFICFFVIVLLLRILCQYNKEYTIVTYGDSITAGFTWQPYLEDFYGKEILNLGIGSSCVSQEGQIPVTLDLKNEIVTRYQADTLKWYWNRFYIPMRRVLKSFDLKQIIQHNINTSKFCAKERLKTIPETTKLIFLMGGTNDAQTNCSMKEFSVCYDSIIDYIYSITPSATIVLMSPPLNVNEFEYKNSYSVNMYNLRMDSIRKTTEWIAKKRDLDYIDLSKCGIDFTNFDRYYIDGIHPNKLGGEIIGNYIINHLNKSNQTIGATF